MALTNHGMSIESRVADFCRQHALFADRAPLLVGFSGGADSTALLLLLARGVAPGRVTAVHFDHGLRGAEASYDADWCRQFCKACNVPFRRVALEVRTQMRKGEGVEEAARRLRLEAWQRLTAKRLYRVALGHHMDDRLETLLMRLTRGSGLSGLAALRPKVEIGGVTYIRPLLECRRQELEEWLREQAITNWRVDHTNFETTLLRNAVRHRWLPMIRADVGHDRGIVAAFQAVAEDADYIEAEALRIADSAVPGLDALRALHPALRLRVLRQWLERCDTAAPSIPSAALLKRLERAAADSASSMAQLPLGNGWELFLEPQKMTVRLIEAEEKTVPELDLEWEWRQQTMLRLSGSPTLEASLEMPPTTFSRQQRNEAWFDAAAIPEWLSVRSWQPGDRLQPFGTVFHKKVQDLFCDAKIPQAHRFRVPLIFADGVPLWLAGVCRSTFAPVTPATKVALRLRVLPMAL